MANACGLFGDLIPNIYIDRVTLEESQRGIDTDSDGKVAVIYKPQNSLFS